VGVFLHQKSSHTREAKNAEIFRQNTREEKDDAKYFFCWEEYEGLEKL